jgi:hypothetical protein
VDRRNIGRTIQKRKQMKYLLLASLLLSGCASIYSTGRSITVVNRTEGKITPAQVNLLVDAAIRSCNCGNVLRDWTLIFTDKWIITQPDKNGMVAVADGYTNPFAETMILTVHDCWADSSLFHEMGHVLGIPHGTSSFWIRVNRADEAFKQKYCPVEYQRELPTP